MGSMVELLKALAGVASADVPDKVERWHVRLHTASPRKGCPNLAHTLQMPASVPAREAGRMRCSPNNHRLPACCDDDVEDSAIVSERGAGR